MKNYYINKNTLAIIPYGENKSLIYEGDKRIIVDRRPNSIIKFNCLIYGSSIDGRLLSCKRIVGYRYKTPILIKEDERILFFPTSSPRLKSCSWISLENINNYYFDNVEKHCVINFNNNVSLDLYISYGVFNNQVLRSTRYLSILDKILTSNR